MSNRFFQGGRKIFQGRFAPLGYGPAYEKRPKFLQLGNTCENRNCVMKNLLVLWDWCPILTAFALSLPNTRSGSAAVAQSEWGRIGHGPVDTNLLRLTGVLRINFQLLENKRKEQSYSRRRHWLAIPEQNSLLRYWLLRGIGILE